MEVLKPFPREEELQTKLARLEELNALRQLCKRCITIEMHPKSQDIPFLEFRD